MLQITNEYKKLLAETNFNTCTKNDLINFVNNAQELIKQMNEELEKYKNTNLVKTKRSISAPENLDQVVQRHYDLINNQLIGPEPLSPIERYRKVLQLIKFSASQPEQRSVGWHNRRGNYITASNVATTLGKNNYQSRKEYLYSSVGLADRFSGNEATDFGEKFEPVATQIYELEMNGIISCEQDPVPNFNQEGKKIEIFESAFVPSTNPDCFFIGGSPDGLVKVNDNNGKAVDGFLIEIKCPLRRWPKENYVPHHYWIQMQIQLEVCNLEYAYFLDYKFIEFRNYDRFERYLFEQQDKVLYKGSIVELPSDGQRFYSPICTAGDCFWDFIDSTLDNAGFVDTDISYWVLVRRHYTKVERDRDFLYSNLHKIFTFYHDRAYYSMYPHELIEN